MCAVMVPAALVERLGEKGSTALTEMLNATSRECADYVLERSAERFERRLIEETSKLRVDMARDMAQLRTDLHAEIVLSRFELLKWNFVFWVGQVVTMAGIVALILRGR